ncbi:response regulator transcription factor [Streptomyces aurantiacus]|uniref:response regulator transcription factor n=1 Tax=Streptomyces aurantiacus TaxID=47760 RepID=UPI0027D84123|nr:response regulator transcription factor [Streptomyces aurantiacus]
MRILLVEDEELLADAISEGLRQESFTVDVVHDGANALERLESYAYDVMVLDRDLPMVHGDEVCRRTIAAGGSVRVLMLTVSTTTAERVDGLSLGADDYLAKPFAFAELVARIKALGRRSQEVVPPVLERCGLHLDPRQQQVYRDGARLDLSRKEFAVLEELLRADGAPVSAEQLLERAWDENTDPFSTIVRVTVGSLRRKLGEPNVIETLTGTGYRLR